MKDEKYEVCYKILDRDLGGASKGNSFPGMCCSKEGVNLLSRRRVTCSEIVLPIENGIENGECKKSSKACTMPSIAFWIKEKQNNVSGGRLLLVSSYQTWRRPSWGFVTTGLVGTVYDYRCLELRRGDESST